MWMVFVSVRLVANDIATKTIADAYPAKLVVGWLRLYPCTHQRCIHLIRVKRMTVSCLDDPFDFNIVAGTLGQVAVSRLPSSAASVCLSRILVLIEGSYTLDRVGRWPSTIDMRVLIGEVSGRF